MLVVFELQTTLLVSYFCFLYPISCVRVAASEREMGLGSSKSGSEPTAGTELETAKANGDQVVTNGDASGQAVPQENGHGGPQLRPGTSQQETAQRRRISFYETVDASEVLPYLIIGELDRSAWSPVPKVMSYVMFIL